MTIAELVKRGLEVRAYTAHELAALGITPWTPEGFRAFNAFRTFLSRYQVNSFVCAASAEDRGKLDEFLDAIAPLRSRDPNDKPTDQIANHAASFIRITQPKELGHTERELRDRYGVTP
jgi:hypothetical protein